jgi:hypothetical protein
MARVRAPRARERCGPGRAANRDRAIIIPESRRAWKPVSELSTSLVVCACVVCGAAIGIYLRRVLPPEHIRDDTRQIVNVASGLVATLAALVLGLMVASAKGSFDARADDIRESSTRVIMLDRSLRQYGPETAETRELLRQLIEARIKRTWGTPDAALQEGTPGSQTLEIEAVRRGLFALTPANDAQKWLLAHALSTAADLEQSRWLLIEHGRSTIPTALLVVLAFWLIVIFANLGLFAPANKTVYTILFVCAVSVATAIFLILEMDQPYQGVIQISNEPLVSALREISR